MYHKTKQKYYVFIVGGRIIGFIYFPRVLVQCEKQKASDWDRTRVAISIDEIFETI